MQRIYMDNAATTPILPEVRACMQPYIDTYFGNPSSIYSYGRETRLAIENVRKGIANTLRCAPGEIFFTSGATESTNTILQGAVLDEKCERIITCLTEHHATLHGVAYAEKQWGVQAVYLDVDSEGHISLQDLEKHLQQCTKKTLVSLLYVNNETGTIFDVSEIARLCKTYGALLHIDAVQAVAHLPFYLDTLSIDFLSASGHKFHAPKGVGFMYISAARRISPLIKGGAQERNMRAGTENVIGIVGMGEAFRLAYQNLAQDRTHITQLKKELYNALRAHFPDIVVYGEQDISKSLYSILNVGFPSAKDRDLLPIQLDMQGVCVSAGSACGSGASTTSHVISAMAKDGAYASSLRFSFSKLNTSYEVVQLVKILSTIIS